VLPVWAEDEAGPYQTIPYPGSRWHPGGAPARYPQEYTRAGTAKLLTVFCPASGAVRVKGVRHCTNAVLHPWLQEQVAAILATLPEPPEPTCPETVRCQWEVWQAGLTVHFPLPETLPPLRLLLVWDNLNMHTNPGLIGWLCAHGVMPLFTPLSGSWLNMAESIQRILKRRALNGQHPQTPEEIITWLEATAAGWNRDPTPFVWGGRRQARRVRARHRLHTLGGSGAHTSRPLRRRAA
jgi:hypothetical protein